LAEPLTNQPTSRTISKSAIFDGPGWGKSQKISVFPNCPTVPALDPAIELPRAGRRGDSAHQHPGPSAGQVTYVPCLTAYAGCPRPHPAFLHLVIHVQVPWTPLQRRAPGLSLPPHMIVHIGARWAKARPLRQYLWNQTRTSCTSRRCLWVRKSTCRGTRAMGGLSAITQGGSSRQNMMREIPGATCPVFYGPCLFHAHSVSFCADTMS
jgi:hypothetical protein